MCRGTIPLMLLKTVFRVGFEPGFHVGVSGHFCEDGCGSDAFEPLVSPNMLRYPYWAMVFVLGKIEPVVIVPVDMDFHGPRFVSFSYPYGFEHFVYR